MVDPFLWTFIVCKNRCRTIYHQPVHHATSQFTSGEMETPDNLPPEEYVLLCDNFSNESLSLSYKHTDWWISSQSQYWQSLGDSSWWLIALGYCSFVGELCSGELSGGDSSMLCWDPASCALSVLSVQRAVMHCFFLLPSCLVLICVRLPWLETQGLKHVARNVNVSELKSSVARTGVKHVRTGRRESISELLLGQICKFCAGKVCFWLNCKRHYLWKVVFDGKKNIVPIQKEAQQSWFCEFVCRYICVYLSYSVYC